MSLEGCCENYVGQSPWQGLARGGRTGWNPASVLRCSFPTDAPPGPQRQCSVQTTQGPVQGARSCLCTPGSTRGLGSNGASGGAPSHLPSQRSQEPGSLRLLGAPQSPNLLCSPSLQTPPLAPQPPGALTLQLQDDHGVSDELLIHPDPGGRSHTRRWGRIPVWVGLNFPLPVLN